ncbi:hypothetical protein SprV_0902653800 [Sparganum proliferum]
MQDACMARNVEEIGECADRNETKNSFASIEAIYGPTTRVTAPPLRYDGTTLLTGKSEILWRCIEHFRTVLNRTSTVSDAAIDRFPQVETNDGLDLPPCPPETIRAVQKLSGG